MIILYIDVLMLCDGGFQSTVWKVWSLGQIDSLAMNPAESLCRVWLRLASQAI